MILVFFRLSVLWLFVSICTAASGAAFAALATPDEQLDAVMAEYWDYHLRENPFAATSAGVNDYNDQLPRLTHADRARRLVAEQAFLQQAKALDHNALGIEGRVNAEVFEWVLEDSIGAHKLNLSRIPFNTFSGFFMAALNMANGVRMEDAGDYQDYVSRLNAIPRYFGENLDNMRVGLKTGFVLPQIVIDGILPTLKAQLKENPQDSSFYEPFRQMSNRVSDQQQAHLRKSGTEAIQTKVIPAFAELVAFFENEYLASVTLAAEELKEGRDYYAFQIRRYTTIVDTTSDAIHEIGLSEVVRIRRDMAAIIEELEFNGDLKDFAAFLRSDPQFYSSSAEDLLKEAAYTAKRIDYVMPGFFTKLPRQSYGVVPVPEEIAPNYTTGAYSGAPRGGSHGGEFLVNTYALDQRPLYELPALTLHEAVPGHHHQHALSAELENVPDFRRELYFSAFGEGWGLYSEKLGVEMGIYRTPYEHFGRLSYEMWRACRLVIDTGIHAKGWTRQQAIDFMMENTSLSASNVRAEIDRYISWPGQALAYKLGELKIWELRRRAESALGESFDLRQFHDLILGNGALPLAMLEAVVDRYIVTLLKPQLE